MTLSRSAVLAAAILLILPAAATAQFQMSDSYTFLKAVRDAKGQDVTDLLNKPGSTIVNTKGDHGEGALEIVVKRQDPTYLRFLLQKGADPNIRDDSGATPLLLAATEDAQDCAEILIAAHANVNLANDRGETPLIRAVQRRDMPMIRALLAAGADPDQTDNLAGESARDYAKADTRTPEIARLLANYAHKGKAQTFGPQLH